jgi:hypothetical protein
VPVPLVGLGGEGGLDLGDEGGVVEAGCLAEGHGDGAVDAAHPDLGVGQVDQGVPGGVQPVGRGAQCHGLPGADLAGQHAQPAGGDEPAQPGDGFLVRGRAEQAGHRDGRGERHDGEAPVRLQGLYHRFSVVVWLVSSWRCGWQR